MIEFFHNIFHLSKWEVTSDIHGGLAMLSLILFGAAIVCVMNLDQFRAATGWLKGLLVALWVDLILLDLLGLLIYVPYRAKGGPKTLLLASEKTAWLHETIFEHKEFLAFAPLVLILVALVITWSTKDQLSTNSKSQGRAVLFSLVTALIFVLVVAGEAVLVTKTAPLH